MAHAVVLHRQRMQRVQQAVGGARLHKAFRARPFRDKPRRQMRGEPPADRRVRRRGTTHRGRGVHRDEARRDGDGVAMVARLEQGGLGEAFARSGPVQDQQPTFGRDTAEFDGAMPDECEADRAIAGTEQGRPRREQAVLAFRQGGKQVRRHMIKIIRGRLPGTLLEPALEVPMRLALAMIVLALCGAPASAQHAPPPVHHGPGHGAPPVGAYAGLQERRIKALSAEREADLRAGRGMALALAAELNGYPGPMHVLELAQALGLTAAQRATAEMLRARMLAEARVLGARIVVLEEELDALFAGAAADAGRLAAITTALGALGGRLREVHLATHIDMRDALDASQREAYARLRGYRPTP